jgi:hypothetical protein
LFQILDLRLQSLSLTFLDLASSSRRRRFHCNKISRIFTFENRIKVIKQGPWPHNPQSTVKESRRLLKFMGDFRDLLLYSFKNINAKLSWLQTYTGGQC